MNARKMLAGAFIVMLGMGMTSFKEDDRNFQISKNLDIFNSIFKELDMFYVDTVNAEKMIQTGVEGMLSLTDPYTEYYPEEEVSSLKEMTTGKYGGIGAAIRYYEAKDRIAVVEPTEFRVFSGLFCHVLSFPRNVRMGCRMRICLFFQNGSPERGAGKP